ncbi:hypothetical protein N7495_008004 [Penicillium taxi]|uniref:uncharacterized protein n=1 Tax=Penicillium taxi TaxID=168475 RepID=UPI00254586B7|nr:uncharacterized protein N7495_008004 [Penicillium taxi]KAJ5887963.1 hypothetical protein N7495_008004 [Penicillium taxi]
MSMTSGTIAEFDIVLSVSKEVINRQLRLLYEKQTNDDGDVNPTKDTVEGDFMPLMSKQPTCAWLRYLVEGARYADINPKADLYLTPRFFILKTFQMTTTAGSVQLDGTKFTSGTELLLVNPSRILGQNSAVELHGHKANL